MNTKVPDVPPLQATIAEWWSGANVGSPRHLRIEASLLVVPYTRQTFSSRYRADRKGEAVRRYNDAKNAIRDVFTILMRKQGIRPLGEARDHTTLGMSLWITVPTARADLSNLFKAVEDAGNGVLYHDDRQIREYGPGGVQLGKPWIDLHLWELS